MMRPRVFRSRIASFSILTVLIGTVMIGVALLAIGYKILVGSGAMNEQQKCHLSILAADQASALKRSTAHAVDIVPNLECEMEEVFIEPGDVSRTRRGRIDDDLVKGLIADKMAECWSRVGAGDLNPFRRLWPELEKTYCMRCAEIRFTDDFREQAEEQRYPGVKGLFYWLGVRRMPGESKSFFEFLAGRKPTDGELVELKEKGNLDLEGRYYIIWRFEKQNPDESINFINFYYGTDIAPESEDLSFGFTDKSKDQSVRQSILLLPRERLSQKFIVARFPNGDVLKKDVCTVMIN